ncbi:MAG: YegS/Rv2252/BmrU family lipid kinase [Butyricicoccus sp.]|nr:YegS/Rv2252/BmrU family lipid kinase [Butyricicoccus sp.]
MKYIFFINPAAGKGAPATRLIPEIEKQAAARGLDCEIYRTKGTGDAAEYARAACGTGEAVRLYACGGDGTLHEIMSGAAGFTNAAVGIIPCGSGNDFVRCFDAPFDDIGRQLEADAHPIDLIRLSDGRYCANMANIGLDCDAAAKMQELKKVPFIRGTLAYVLALAIEFCKPLGYHLHLTCDDRESFEADCLLTALGNGRFCGGGFCGVPLAELSDGLMDLSIIKKMSRLNIVQIIGKYHDGTHLDSKLGKTHVQYRRCQKLHIASDKPFRLCIDGEISAHREMTFELVPAAVKLLIPRK